MSTSSSATASTRGAFRATAEGTTRYAARFADRLAADFHRPLADLSVSSLGIGTYLGECSEPEDVRYASVVRHALGSGINLIDTAINYRCQRSERAVGRALREAIGSGDVSRDEVVVCTKGGFIPLDGEPPSSREAYDRYLEREFLAPGLMRPEDVVGGGHCLAPRFLEAQVERSRTNIGVRTIDVYYLHNPEQQLDGVDRTTFRIRLRDAFATCEERVIAGEIAHYGCATWNGFRLTPGSRHHLSLEDLVAIAREVAGDDHHFACVQLPVNLAMTEAVRVPTQPLGGRMVSLLEAAAALGVQVVASASLLQAQLASNLPPAIRETFADLRTDAQRAIAFTRALPVAAALVGMRRLEHLAENLEGVRAGTAAHPTARATS